MTKAAYLLSDMDKEYEAVFRFGIETDTLDTEGQIVAEAPVPELSAIQQASEAFSGFISQVPPAFSAVKINGKRAYAQARKGLDVVMPQRTVEVSHFDILEWKSPDLKVLIRCSKGTYIRSIARDLGLAAGSRAYCTELRRSAIGPFSVLKANIPDEVSAEDGITPVDFAELVGIPVLELPENTAEKLRGGFPPEKLEDIPALREGLNLCVDNRRNPAALLELSGGRAGYKIVFD